MNADLKRRWVEALRSGEYGQGAGILRDGNYYCCIGVLCDLVDPDGWGEDGHHGGEWEFAPAAVREVVGWTERAGDPEHDLTDMNDSGTSFREIADWIEANVEVSA